METKINKFNKHKCACCGYYTIIEIHDTCPVCFWEQDDYQEENINDAGGPNTTSLRESRQNFIKYNVMDPEFLSLVRAPNYDEVD